MRILHVSSGNLYGGVETMLVTLARYQHVLPALEPEFALCFQARLSDELGATGVPIHLLGEVRTRRPFTIWRARRRLGQLLSERQIGAVVCHMPWSQAIFGSVARRACIPLVLWVHGPTSRWHWLDLWARFTPPDLTICNSRFTSTTRAHLYRNLPSEVVYPPLGQPMADLSAGERASIRAELGTSVDATVIVQASRMESWKGHGFLLDALGQLRDVPGWVCWIAGGPQRSHERHYLETLEQAASKLGIACRVRFLGERSDVPRMLRAADLYCQPNTGPEPFGLAFVEALAAGIPVIATSIGAAPEIIDGSCGMLVKPGDVQALAGALRRLIKEPRERIQLGSAGPERARKLCDPSAQIHSLAAVLSRIARAANEPLNGNTRPAAVRAGVKQPL